MRTRIQKWGNSLALRIPRPFAQETGLEQQSEVELTVVDGKLVVQPVPETAWNLDDLLVRVTRENLPSEVDMGPPAGKEVW